MKEITSVHNAAVQLLRELQKPRARRENGLFVCESAKLVGEAVALGLAQALFIEKQHISCRKRENCIFCVLRLQFLRIFGII